MNLELEAAGIDDAAAIHRMQLAAFQPLLEKYQDHELSPAAEEVCEVERRLGQVDSTYYLILLDGEPVGAVRVVDLRDRAVCRISPIFVLPSFQGRGIAQWALAQLESLHHPRRGWLLQTIAEVQYGDRSRYREIYAANRDQIGDPNVIYPGMTLELP